MPRERIHHGTENKHAYEGDHGTPALDIEWMREPTGRVQVAIDMARETWIINAKSVNEDPSVAARAIYTESLTRQEINHMIKTLRRARDAAYGADE